MPRGQKSQIHESRFPRQKYPPYNRHQQLDDDAPQNGPIVAFVRMCAAAGRSSLLYKGKQQRRRPQTAISKGINCRKVRTGRF